MKKLTFVLLAVMALLILAACAPAQTPVPTTAPPTVAPPTQAAAAATATKVPATTAPTVAASNTITPTRPPAPTNTPVLPKVTAAAGALKVQFWHALTGASQVAEVQALADKFNAANPTIYIVPTSQGSYDPTRQKVNAAIQANSIPDLVLGNPGDLAEYYLAGAVAPMDDYIKDAKDGLSAAQLAEINSSLTFDKFDGKTIGASFGRSIQVMYYNVDMLKAAGFDKAPATWDDFDKVCAAVTKGDVFCYAFVPSASTFASWVWSRGGTYASTDEKKATFDEQAGVDTLKWLKNLADKKYGYQPAGSFGDQTDFGNNKVAFTFGSTAGLPFYNDAVKGKFKWAIGAMPAATGQKQNVDTFGPGVAIMKTTPEKQKAAWLWVKFLLSKDVEVEWGAVTTYFPAPKSALDALVSMDNDKATALNAAFGKVQDQYKLAVTFLPLGRREPVSPAWQSVRGIVADMQTAVFTGKSGSTFTSSDPAAAAAEGVKRVNDSLASYGK